MLLIIRYFVKIVILTFFVYGLLISSSSCKKKDKFTDPKVKITIANPTIPYSSLVHIAIIKDFFTDEGLDVINQPQPYGKIALDSVLEGKADLATVAETPVMFAIMNGKMISVVAVIENSYKNLVIIARKDRGIKSPSDLAGKTIGVTRGTSADFFLYSFFSIYGIDMNSVKIKNMNPQQILDSIVKGDIDASSSWSPDIEFIHKALGNNVILFYDKSVYTEAFCLVGTQEYNKKNPEAIKKVLRGLIRAEAFLNDNQEESRRLVAEFIKMDRALLDELWGNHEFRVALDQALLLSLEDISRWAIKNRLTVQRNMPNFLNYIYLDGLRTVKPEASRIIQASEKK